MSSHVLAAIFLETYARPLLVVHWAVGGALVAASTHHFIWAFRYLRGNFAKRRGEKILALVSTLLFVASFFLGNLLYPTYKVRVRAEFFDNSLVVANEIQNRKLGERMRIARDQPTTAGESVDSNGAPFFVPGPSQAEQNESAYLPVTSSLGALSRLFDIKEHWVAFGLALSILLCVITRRIDLKKEPVIAKVVVGISALVMLISWSGAVIGIWVTSFRSLGSL